MIVVLALAGGALGALWYAGALTAARLRWVGAAAGVALALRLLLTGQWLGALIVGAVTAWLAAGQRVRRSQPDISPEEAGRMLGVSPGAGAVEINAAWRRLIAEVHPDKGGSAEASARVNAARDTLLKHLRSKGR
ncbi:J domain-containing protein [Sphingosinicella microcystinivorans]|uniref:J domain-containing protein n=1 Tax=Sphingosinicella microcystinivorans TaxID=335406 RepID=A0AAD1G152_SPHMI|nr:J domain-containing protein [Sphingosinicella microcystinivorans]RKS91287.1 hypothetical protein DFR51_0846 [Sphingosinicella microcystinivorans]BBE34256.1 hypothetical protein SmB9_19140 [Sphingosinicella microcystinivorans]